MVADAHNTGHPGRDQPRGIEHGNGQHGRGAAPLGPDASLAGRSAPRPEVGPLGMGQTHGAGTSWSPPRHHRRATKRPHRSPATSWGRCRTCRRPGWRRRFPCVVWHQIRGELLGWFAGVGAARHSRLSRHCWPMGEVGGSVAGVPWVAIAPKLPSMAHPHTATVLPQSSLTGTTGSASCTHHHDWR
jgi:hypothetical protein